MKQQKYSSVYKLKRKFLYFGNNFYKSRFEIALKRYFTFPHYFPKGIRFAGLWLNGEADTRKILEQRKIYQYFDDEVSIGDSIQENKSKKNTTKLNKVLPKINKHKFITTEYLMDLQIYDQKVIDFLKQYVTIVYTYCDGSLQEFPYKDQFEINHNFYYVARSKQDGSYIGLLQETLNKINTGVKFFYAYDDHKVASIGFDPIKKEWHGWSHRAWNKFKIGHVVNEGSCETSSGYTDEYVKEHPEVLKMTVPVGFEVKTLDDARRCAVAFADSVG